MSSLRVQQSTLFAIECPCDDKFRLDGRGKLSTYLKTSKTEVHSYPLL